MIKINCKENKQDTCDILNEKLGDCEIVEDRQVCWRCPSYLGCEEINQENVKNDN